MDVHSCHLLFDHFQFALKIEKQRHYVANKGPSSQGYAPTSNAEEAEVERFCEDLQDLLELTPPKDVLFIIRD